MFQELILGVYLIYKQRYYYADIHCPFCGSTGKLVRKTKNWKQIPK